MLRLVHLVTYNQKFIPAQWRFLNAEFGPECQRFYLVGGGAGVEDLLGGNTVRLRRRTLMAFIVDAHRADRLVLNGLFSNAVIVTFLLFPWLIRKAVWLPWGGDLYWPKLVPQTGWNRFVDYLRGVFFRRLDAIATPTYGDYHNAQKFYRTNARYINACPNIFSFEKQDLDIASSSAAQLKKTKPTIIIQVGNSADPSNEHLEVFEWLRKFADEDIEVHVPLSYGADGANDYRDRVLRRGFEMFGEKFKPIMNLMEAREYNQYLAAVDVMVFNHRRQQGFGNMAISLYMGTKMYLRSVVSTWEFLAVEMGCTLFDTLDVQDLSFGEFTKLSNEVKQENRRALAHLFDRAWQRGMWEKLYHE